MNSKHPDTDRHSNDLTQLSSREQLSALMDGALPADQTRFLLRRLQHDESLAASWERWRIAGEAMRGLAPTQRLPADFARRVSASLHDGASVEELAPVATVRSPGWVRWAGGAAVAASVAMVALLAVRPVGVPEGATTPQVAAASAAEPAAPSLAAVEALPQPAGVAETPAAVPPATVAVALATRPSPRGRPAQAGVKRQSPAPVAAGQVPAVAAVLAPSPIVTRPWPRAVLPQYADGGLAVGFGDGAAAVANPFQQPQLTMVPGFESPASDGDSEARAASSEADAGSDPAPETEPR